MHWADRARFGRHPSIAYWRTTITGDAREPPGFQSIAPPTPNCQASDGRYYGWVAYVLYLLPQMSGGDLRELLDSLNHHLFGTSYKSTIMAMPPSREVTGKRNLNLKIPAGDVGEWVLGDLVYADPGRSTLNLV